MSVKLVAEVGVGTVAAGVAKANSDHVVIAGHDGGTGASPVSSIQSAGVPWEIGLAETQQTLVLNKLRDRIIVQTDGQMKTGRDVVIAALLGAEEMGFATAPLITMGCIMMRACHLNTCPVGIATQDPDLIKKFKGEPEQVVNFFFFVAEEVRRYMAQMGFTKFEDMIGRTDMLEAQEAIDHWKARGVDLTHLLAQPDCPPEWPRRRVRPQDPVLDDHLDHEIIRQAQPALERGERVHIEIDCQNKHRAIGGILSGEIARRYGEEGLPEDTIEVTLHGSAGQSFGAWLAAGVTLTLWGDANDYTGKGMSGGVMAVRPPEGAALRRRGERDHRQHGPLRRHQRQGVLPRPRRRALLRAELGRAHGRRGRRRPRLRVHDRRPGRRARARPGATSPPACRAASRSCSTRRACSPSAATPSSSTSRSRRTRTSRRSGRS